MAEKSVSCVHYKMTFHGVVSGKVIVVIVALSVSPSLLPSCRSVPCGEWYGGSRRRKKELLASDSRLSKVRYIVRYSASIHQVIVYLTVC